MADLQIDSTRTNSYLVEALKSSPIVFSPWHCQQECIDDYDCQLFSWTYKNQEGKKLIQLYKVHCQ